MCNLGQLFPLVIALTLNIASAASAQGNGARSPESVRRPERRSRSWCCHHYHQQRNRGRYEFDEQ